MWTISQSIQSTQFNRTRRSNLRRRIRNATKQTNVRNEIERCASNDTLTVNSEANRTTTDLKNRVRWQTNVALDSRRAAFRELMNLTGTTSVVGTASMYIIVVKSQQNFDPDNSRSHDVWYGRVYGNPVYQPSVPRKSAKRNPVISKSLNTRNGESHVHTPHVRCSRDGLRQPVVIFHFPGRTHRHVLANWKYTRFIACAWCTSRKSPPRAPQTTPRRANIFFLTRSIRRLWKSKSDFKIMFIFVVIIYLFFFYSK